MEKNNMVSIIMPCYNSGKYILKAVESVVNQTYTNWELIIVNDCSDDDTNIILEKYINDNNENRIKIINNSKNMGAAASRNKAIEKANGRWIAFLDSDDSWEEKKIEEQIKFMVDNNYHFTYTNYNVENENGNIVSMVTGPRNINKFTMYLFCWPGCLTVMYDAKFVGKIKIGNIKKNNDYAMWLLIIKKCNCYLLNETLATYSRRIGSVSNVGKLELIRWHYKLYRQELNKNIFISLLLTCTNIFFAAYKKIFYTKKYFK